MVEDLWGTEGFVFDRRTEQQRSRSDGLRREERDRGAQLLGVGAASAIKPLPFSSAQNAPGIGNSTMRALSSTS